MPMYDPGFRSATLRVYAFLRSIRQTASAMRLAKCTVQRWRGRASNTRQQRPQSKATRSDVQAAIKHALLSNPWLSCTELAAHIWSACRVRVSRQLVSIAVKKAGFSKLKARSVAASGYDPPRLRQFLQDLMVATSKTSDQQAQVVAVDECGFDQRMLPRAGYAPKGTRLRCVRASKGTWKRTHMMMAMGAGGQAAYSIQHAPITSDVFADFIQQLPYAHGSVLVMDNIAFHKSAAARAAMEHKGYTPLFIPPYCPDANPVENLFGIIKNRFRTRWACVDKVTFAAGVRVDGESSFDDVLEDAVHEVLLQIDATSLFQHAVKWLRDHSASAPDPPGGQR